MVGGYSFERSKFNRATQALRQVGSSFKPIVYTAAIDRGFTPASLIDDAPVSFPPGPTSRPIRRRTTTTSSRARSRCVTRSNASRNVPAVRVMDQLGPSRSSPTPASSAPVADSPVSPDRARRRRSHAARDDQRVRGVPEPGRPHAAYSVLKVTDRAGNVLEENRPEPKDAIRADTAYVITNLLRGVVQRGTAAKAASLDWPIGGKTGTTDDYTDAWFVGFDPDITIGVWIGSTRRSRSAAT